MRRFPLIFALVILLVAQPLSVAAQQAPAGSSKLILEDSTPVKLRLSRNLSSADAQTGDQVDFEVLEEIRVADLLVVPKGGIAWGTVTEAQAKRRMGRSGKLNVTIDHVRLASGEKAALRAVKETKGKGSTGAMTAGMVATSLIVWPAAPVFLLMHGKDITIPKGTEITAYVNGDFEVFRSKFQPSSPVAAAPAPDSSAPRTPDNPAIGSSVLVSSTPAGADIELDGSFVGSTPSIISMPVGDHQILIKKKSFKPWERKIKATLGSIKIEAELEPDR